jgi:hypothetical protein
MNIALTKVLIYILVPKNFSTFQYRVFRVEADWTFILPSELPAKELRHLPGKMPPRGTTY